MTIKLKIKLDVLSILVVFISVLLLSCTKNQINYKAEAVLTIQNELLDSAMVYLTHEPVTLTSYLCTRSAGGEHDFYSEGDYWWPNPEDAEGPYIRKDGLTNPENFTAHRKAMLRFSIIVGNLCSAYLITNDTIYSLAIKKHLKAWFIDDSTKMNPNLLYAQAINGRFTGRGIGIIDGIHLMEVAQAVRILEKNNLISDVELVKIKAWFADFTTWLTTHEYGLAEMVHPNNHGTCWNMQVAIFAKLTQNDSVLNFCKHNFLSNLLPSQMANNGSFPLELERTKPYGYSLFNLDAMVMNCLILSDENNNLWEYRTSDGRSIKKAISYMAPYIENKASWTFKPDVMYWENWPVAQPSLLFGAIYYNNLSWFELWKNSKHFYEVEEVLRNMPVRNPLIWIE